MSKHMSSDLDQAQIILLAVLSKMTFQPSICCFLKLLQLQYSVQFSYGLGPCFGVTCPEPHPMQHLGACPK